MKKQIMPSQDALRALYPGDREKDLAAVRATLARLPENEKEQPIMKRKVSAALVCACILLAITCVAVAVSTNVFGLFAGQWDEDSGLNKYLNALDRQSATGGGTQTVSPSADDKYGKVVFTIEQSFYDGETLTIAYSLKGNANVIDDTWLPADDEISALGLMETAIAGVSTEEQMQKAGAAWLADDAALIEKLKAIQEKGEKKGLIEYNTYLGDGAYFGDGEDDYLDLNMSDEQRQADGTLLGYKRFESPLPDAVRGKEQITVRFSLYRGVHYIYFDGETWYTGGGERTKESLYATITRAAENTAVSYPVAAEFEGYGVSGTLTVSAIEVTLDVTLTSKTDRPMYDEEDLNGIAFLDYALYAGDEALHIFSAEFGTEGMSENLLISYNAPTSPVTELRLVPVFTDRALEAAGKDGMAERPGEAIVIPLTAAP